MDLKGSLVDTHLRIYPSETLKQYLSSIKITKDTPPNVVSLIQGTETKIDAVKKDYLKKLKLELNAKELIKLNKIKESGIKLETPLIDNTKKSKKKSENEAIDSNKENQKKAAEQEDLEKKNENTPNDNNENPENGSEKKEQQKQQNPYLTTQDMDWLYSYLQKQRLNGEKAPYLHELLEGSHIETPENAVIKRNPDLEARCVKLRAQQEAREYRKMTKGVDNVRIRFPEESIAYQLKQINRQLIAIGQFIISIFAGFLFGFRGIEWMVGTLDMGFRMLLGVMCALIIALAEIYFLAKKLNEELSIPETVQLGGPPKFADDANYPNNMHKGDLPKIPNKEHQE